MEDSYFAQGHGINQISTNKPKRKSVSVPTFIVSLIMVACLVIIIFLKWNDILGFFGVEEENNVETETVSISVGDEVAFSGNIKNDGDMVNYTHTYFSTEYGTVIGLKSSRLNLNNYSNNVYFEGIVEKIYHEIPVVSVITIYEIENQEDEGLNTGDEEIIEKNEKYLPKLGLFFTEDFFQNYSLINEGDGSAIKIKNLETNIISSILYSKCNKSRSEENCDELNKFYSTSSSKKLVDKYEVSYYKDLEVNSRFFSNDSTFGYRIHDEQESLINDLSRMIVVVNKSYADKNIKPNISTLCVIDHATIKNIEKTDYVYKNNNFYYTVEGTDVDGNTITCELLVDPTLDKSAQLVNIGKTNKEESSEATEEKDTQEESTPEKTEQKEETSESTSTEVVYNRDTEVEQFPIDLEKTLTFTSSRGHSFVFPSRKIAYQGVSASENFDQVGVNCFSAMNVVKYEDKELVETQGSIVIYECNVKNSFDDSDKTLIYKQVGDRHFVIKIVDPARVNFANNIEIIA